MIAYLFKKNDRYLFSKVQNVWVFFNNDCFFSKNETIVLKTIEKRIEKRSFNDRFKKRLTTLLVIDIKCKWKFVKSRHCLWNFENILEKKLEF